MDAKYLLLGLLLCLPVATAIPINNFIDENCNGNTCTRTIYSYPRFINTTEGYKDFTEVTTAKWENGVLNFSHINGNYWVTIKPTVYYNMVEYEMNQLPPNIIITPYKKSGEGQHKYGVLFEGITEQQAANVDFIQLHVEQAGGLTWDDVKLENQSIIIKNKVQLGYNDLLENNFSLSLADKRTVIIGNLGPNIVGGVLDIDPFIQLNYSNGYMKVNDYAASDTNESVVITVDLVSAGIPQGSTINESMFYIYRYLNPSSINENTSWYRYNGTHTSIEQFVPSGAIPYWIPVNTTEAMQNASDEGASNLTFYGFSNQYPYYVSEYATTDGSGYMGRIAGSQEMLHATMGYGTASLRPYMNITFEYPPINLYIDDPTTESPDSITAGDNVTVTYHIESGGSNITSVSELPTVKIGNLDAPVVIIPASGTGEVFEGWESGSWPNDNWTYYESDSGGQQTFSTTYKRTGSYGMFLDRTPSGTYTLNEIITQYDFTGATELTIDYYAWDQGDETNAASDHTGHQNSDGIFYTCDGNYWYALETHSGAATWTNHNHVISDDTDWCGTANSSFAIKLTQYDNFPATSDGWGFDDINITFLGSTSTTQFNYCAGGTCIVNVTTNETLSGLQDTNITQEYAGTNYTSIETENFNFGGGGNDTCTYTSGNWEVDCSDNCKITTNTNVAGQLILSGSGTFTIQTGYWVHTTGDCIIANTCQTNTGGDLACG